MAKNSVTSEYAKTYTSFSGCDIVPMFGNTVIGELQAISISVHREKAPIYTMGSADPRSYSRGKRGIAGNLVFTVFDRDALIEALKDQVSKESTFQRIGGDNDATVLTIDEWDKMMTGSVDTSGTASDLAKSVASSATIRYGDEVPPFDITITFANEYGQKAVQVIYGVELLNEGVGYSMDNVVSEKACTFVARRIDYLKAVD